MKKHHGNSDLSAAYYVEAEKNSGDIVFFDPRQVIGFITQPQNKE